MDPDRNAVVSFLGLLRPEGPHALTAIHPDKDNAVRTKVFDNAEFAAEWACVQNHKHGCNVYYTPATLTDDARNNPPRKFNKKHIESSGFLWADIDPAKGEDLAAEQDRILSALQHAHAEPTFVVFSGGGFQALWRLGEPANLADTENRNRTLADALGGDNVQNLDRLLRLPGTVNHPDARKREKGRKPVLARLVAHRKHTYKLDDFRVFVEDKPLGTAKPIKVDFDPGTVARLSSIDDLPATVPDWAKVLIVQGHDPENPNRFESRSEALFAACCQMHRSGVKPETIYAVITGPDFAISASVLDKAGPHRYALRQIERSYADAMADDPIAMLNQEWFWVPYGGKRFVARETPNGLDFLQSLTFREQFDNTLVTIGTDRDGNPVQKPLGSLWIQSPQRRSYQRIVFDPAEQHDPDTEYNLWRGLAVEPKAGDCDLVLGHIENVVCAGDAQLFKYLLRWCAFLVQRPAERPETVPIIFGRPGTGKTVVGELLVSLFGEHGASGTGLNFLTGKFNHHLANKRFVFADEVTPTLYPAHEAALRDLVTSSRINLERKGVDIQTVDNRLAFMLISNDDSPVRVDIDDRRLVHFRTADTYIQDRNYFSPLFEQIANGGREAFLAHLLGVDLTGWNPAADRIVTRYTRDAQQASYDGFEAMVFEWLQSGELPGEVRTNGEAHTAAAWLQRAWQEHGTDPSGKFSSNRIAAVLHKPQGGQPGDGRSLGLDRFECHSTRRIHYTWPPLPEARALWDSKMGTQTDWYEQSGWAGHWNDVGTTNNNGEQG
ncbi:MAG: DUF5906 domain-containing protein [Planctomycetota bacterium]